MVANALKTWVKHSSRWEKRWFVRCNWKFCELLRRFLQLNNNMKIPLFESLGVSEIRKIYRKYFEFHNSRSSYVFRWVYHIDRKDELIKHSMKFLLQRELINVFIFLSIFHQCNEHNLNSFIRSLKYLKNFDQRWS